MTILVFSKSFFETVAQNFNADKNRFYISGFSIGSMMSNFVGCAKSDWLAGVALVSGRLERGFQCEPSEPIALFQVNGGRDTAVPADGSASRRGYNYASTTAVAAAWNRGTGCETDPQPWSSALTEKHGLHCTASCPEGNDACIG